MLPEQDTWFEHLYREYFELLYRRAVIALKNPARAQDVVQDTFHEALRHIDKLMVHKNPGGWLMQTLKHKIRDSERQRWRYLRRFISLDTDFPLEAADSNSTIELDEPTDSEATVLSKVEQTLTAGEYQLLKRLILEQASHVEVADELGISVYASQKRLERARKKLSSVFPDRKQKK